MMRAGLVFALLLVGSPAFSQTKVYTKADLGQPLSPNRPTVTAEQLASLVAHQFHAPQPLTGPEVIIIGTASEIAGTTFAGPFGTFPPIPPPRRLDGTTFDMPPWSVSTYLGHPYGRLGYGFGGYGRPYDRVARPDGRGVARREVPSRTSAPTPGRVVSTGGMPTGHRRAK